jgi:hypothetical protein
MIAASVAVGYGIWFLRFDRHWDTLRPGATVEAVVAAVGKPDDDRMRANILGESSAKTVWEYARGPYVYEAYFDRDQQGRPTTLYSVERRQREGREWLSLRARPG